MKKMKIFSLILAAAIAMNLSLINVYAENYGETGFELTDKRETADLDGTAYCFTHKKTGAEVVWIDNGSDRREFAIGFKTPPIDSKGANHVLEHALLCGSEKYPTKNIMHYIQQGTSSLILNGVTDGDYTYYLINTSNETEFYNTMDVYLNGIFHPLFLTDKNIFRQQGIRLEYDNGRARYNGVVYNELRLKNLNTESNSVNFTADQLYRGIYGDTPPAFSSGGELDELKQLTYEDLTRVYHAYYIPSNSMTYISGNQDIDKTLKLFDSFFSEYDHTRPDIDLEDTKKIPEERVSEYNITDHTQTVDIGFMHSGVTLDSDPKEMYAREIIFEIIKKKMDELNAKNYISGGKCGGISNTALLLSEIPVEKKQELISAYNRILEKLEEDGFDKEELENQITEYMENRKHSFYNHWENIFDGMLYQDNPFVFTAIEADQKYLSEHSDYFTKILKKYFTQNPYRKIVVSGNGSFGSEDSYVSATAEELEKIKRETEEFQAWASKADSHEVIEKIPFLTLEEVKDAPDVITPIYEDAEGISFYNTVKADGDSADLFFPLDIEGEELMLVQLMYAFINSQKTTAGIENTYFGLLPMESETNNQKCNPHFMIGISGEQKDKTLRTVLNFLKSSSAWDPNDLAEYIKSEPDKILKNGYYDPYSLSYELKQSALSAESKFYACTTGSVQQGSVAYYHFLKNVNLEDIPALAEKIKALLGRILDCKPIVEYVGGEGYGEFKNEVIEHYKDKKERQDVKLLLPIGYHSAATITSLEDANHFMLAGQFDTRKYSGKLNVLGNVLSSKYILPEMRGKYGAYGASIRFYNNGMTAAAAGLSDIDLAVQIWQGMGDFLRELDMTQKELDAIIVSAVKEFDEYGYTDTEYGAQSALSDKTEASFKQRRAEMMSVTVDDLRGYADFIDEIVSQNRIFAVLGKSAADSAEVDFAYYADAETLKITPMLTRKPHSYIQGRSETMFAPDDFITRAEASVLIDRLTADQRSAQSTSPFSDVTQNDWFYDAVVSLSETGLIHGYENGSFEPQNHITRAELAAILAQFIFDSHTENDTIYSDINENDWFYVPVSKMIEHGFMSGYGDNTIRPNQSITRAEAVTILNRMLNWSKPTSTKNPFADVDGTHWAYKEILAAAGE